MATALSLSARARCVSDVRDAHEAALRGEDDEGAVTALIHLLHRVLVSNVSGNKARMENMILGGDEKVPDIVLAKIVSSIRLKAGLSGGHSIISGGTENGMMYASVLEWLVCPGSMSSTWERKIRELVVPLDEPVRWGAEEPVRRLLREGSEITEAVCLNNVPLLRRKLKAVSAYVNALELRDQFGWTLLHHASHGGCLDAMRFLIAEGLSPNCLDNEDRSPLHIAAAGLHTDAIALLLEAGAWASVATLDRRGCAPINMLVRAASLSSWQMRMSPSELTATACSLMRDAAVDLWRIVPVIDENATKDIYKEESVSILIQLLSIGDFTLVQTIISLVVQPLRAWFGDRCNGSVRQADSDLTGPLSARIKAAIGSQSDREGPSPGCDISYHGIKSQVRVAIAIAIRRKRVRILQLLVDSLSGIVDAFDLIEGNALHAASAKSSRYDFYFRCLELSIARKCLRTTLVLLDFGKQNNLFYVDPTAHCASSDHSEWLEMPSCFLHLVVSQSDPLMLRLVLERLAEHMDIWALHPASTCCSMNVSIHDAVEIDDGTTESFTRIASSLTLLRRTLSLGAFGNDLLFNHLSLFSPLALACLVNNPVAVDLILSRLDSPYRGDKRSSSSVTNAHQMLSGCSPIVCGVLMCSLESLRTLKEHMGECAFYSAVASEDTYGLSALHCLMHVMRLQHDHFGESCVWAALEKTVGGLVSSSQKHHTDKPLEDIKPSRGSSSGIYSPIFERLQPKATFGARRIDDAASDVETAESHRSRGDSSAKQPHDKAIHGSHKTPDKSNAKFDSKREHHSPLKRQKGYFQRLHSSRLLKIKKRELHQQSLGDMLAMSGFRYGTAEILELLNLLTECPSNDFLCVTNGGSGLNENGIEESQSIRKLEDHLLRICERLRFLAFPEIFRSNTENSQELKVSVNLTIVRNGAKYCRVDNGDTEAALPERTAILLQAPGDMGDASMPKGFLVEDVVRNVLRHHPVFSAAILEQRRRRMLWFKHFRIGKRLIVRDMEISKVSRISLEDINDAVTRNHDQLISNTFAKILAAYSDAPPNPFTSEFNDSSPTIHNLESASFLRKMRVLSGFMVSNLAPSSVNRVADAGARNSGNVSDAHTPKMKADRSWALLGQCVWILLEETNSSFLCNADVAWDNIRRKFCQQNGVVAVDLLKRAATCYVSHEQYMSAMSLIDPVNFGADLNRSSPTSAATAIQSFVSRVLQSLGRQGQWARDRFGLCISTLATWVGLVLSDVDRILSSSNLRDNYNRDGSRLSLKNRDFGEHTAEDIIYNLEEALYLECVLSRARTEPCPESCGHSGMGPGHREQSALLCLLNRSVCPLPVALPPLVCAIGHLISELSQLKLLPQGSSAAHRVGVTTEVRVGFANHLGRANRTIPRVQMSGEISGGTGTEVYLQQDDAPSVLYENAVCCLIKQFQNNKIRLFSTLSTKEWSSAIKMQGYPSLSAKVRSWRSSSRSVESRLTMKSVASGLSPLLCTVGRKLWAAAKLIIEMHAISEIGTENLHDPSYFCALERGENSFFNNSTNSGSAVDKLCRCLAGTYGGENNGPPRSLAGYFCDEAEYCDTATTADELEAFKAPEIEIVRFIDVCLRQGGPMRLMIDFIKSGMSSAREMTFMDLSDLMLNAIKYNRYEVCEELLTYVAAQDLDVTISDRHAPVLGIPNIEQRNWAIESAFVLFKAFLETKSESFTAQMAVDDYFGGKSFRDAWYLPLVNRCLGHVARIGKKGIRSAPSSVITHFDGPLKGLCQDRESGGIIMRDGSLVDVHLIKRYLPLLNWALPPAYEALGLRSASGHSIFHTLAGLGAPYHAMLNKLVERISSNDEKRKAKLLERMYMEDKFGVTPVFQGLASQRSDLMQLSAIISNLTVESPNANDVYGYRKPAAVDAVALCADFAKKELTSGMYVQNLIENPSTLPSITPIVAPKMVDECLMLRELVCTLKTVEQKWKRLCRSDFQPFIGCLYNGSVNKGSLPSSTNVHSACPYNSVQCAKVILLALKVPYSRLAEGSHAKVSKGEDISLASLNFSDLLPTTLMKQVSWKTATDMKGIYLYRVGSYGASHSYLLNISSSDILVQWVRARGDRQIGKPRRYNDCEKPQHDMPSFFLRCRRLEERLIVCKFRHVLLADVGAAGFLDKLNGIKAAFPRSKLEIENRIPVMSVTSLRPSNTISDNKLSESPQKHAWEGPTYRLPDQLLVEMKVISTLNGTRSSAESSLKHVSEVVNAWSFQKEEVIRVLNLAYDVLDFARSVCICRMLCGIVSVSIDDLLQHETSEHLEFVNHEEDTEELLSPAAKPQMPYIISKGMRKHRRLSTSKVAGVDCTWEDSSSEENESLLKEIDCSDIISSDDKAKKEMFTNALEATAQWIQMTREYHDYVCSQSEAIRVSSLGVFEPIYPSWRRSIGSTIMDFEPISTLVKKEYKDVLSRLFKKMSLDGCESRMSDIWIAEYTCIYQLLSCEKGCTKRLQRARQRFLGTLSLLCSITGNHRICEYLCRIARSVGQRAEVNPGASSEHVFAHLGLLESHEEAAYLILKLIHEMTICDVININKLDDTSTAFYDAHEKNRGKKAESRTVFQQLLKELHILFRNISPIDPEPKPALVRIPSSMSLLKSMIRSHDESLPCLSVLPAFSKWTKYELHFLSCLNDYPSVGVTENCVVPDINGRAFDFRKYASPSINRQPWCNHESMRCLNVGQVCPLDSELHEFVNLVAPRTQGIGLVSCEITTMPSSFGKDGRVLPPRLRPQALKSNDETPGNTNSESAMGSAVFAATKVVVERAVNKVRVAYDGVTIIHNFFRCLYGILNQKKYYEADPQIWKISNYISKVNSLSAAALRLLGQDDQIEESRWSIESSLLSLCGFLLSRNPLEINRFNKSLCYDNLTSIGSVDADKPQTGHNAECISPVFVASIRGSYKLVELFLRSDVPNRLFEELVTAPCHQFLVWHALLECPPLSSDERNVSIYQLRMNYNSVILLLLKRGFSAGHPQDCSLSCLYLAALKQLPDAVLALIKNCSVSEIFNPGFGHLDLPFTAFHALTLASSFPAALLKEVVDGDGLRRLLRFSGEIVVPSAANDIATHVITLRRYFRSCRICASVPSQYCSDSCHFCEKEDRTKWRRIAHSISTSYLNLLPPAYRLKGCPLSKYLKSIHSGALSDGTNEIPSQKPLKPARLNCSGLHLALAARDLDKIEFILGRESDGFLNWLSPSIRICNHDDVTDNAAALSSYSQLMHLACYYGFSQAVALLSDIAIMHHENSLRLGLYAGMHKEDMTHAIPGCYLSFFFEPTNSSCTPIEVAIQKGHYECVGACLAAAEKVYFSIGASNTRTNLTWSMLELSIVLGTGGDKMASLLLTSLSSEMSALDLWRSLCSQARSRHSNYSSGETVMHIAIRRGYTGFMNKVCKIYDSLTEDRNRKDGEKDGIFGTPRTCDAFASFDSVTDSKGLTLLQTSIASGHGSITAALRGVFPCECRAIAVIAVQLRKLLIKRHLKRRRAKATAKSLTNRY